MISADLTGKKLFKREGICSSYAISQKKIFFFVMSGINYNDFALL